MTAFGFPKTYAFLDVVLTYTLKEPAGSIFPYVAISARFIFKSTGTPSDKSLSNV